MFIDRIKVFARAGKGGRGSVSFRREKFVPKGGPDGGDGGRGGDVILRADRHVDNLVNLFYEPIIKAKNGGHGMGKKMAGRAGATKIVKVPVGTIVYAVEGAQRSTPNAEQSGIPIVDLTRDGQEFVLCRGGAGGKGNVHFKSSRNRAPRQYTEGEEGEQGYFLFELRTIADAGLVGYPNAGKSTLLRKISAARPKVAAYPFTTLHPIVGVMEMPGYRRATLADIPGLIEGAHRGVGLGHQFLRHVERARVLLHVVEATVSDPVATYEAVREELELYNPALAAKPELVALNKIDRPDVRERLLVLLERFRQEQPQVRVIPVSALTTQGVEELIDALAATLAALPKEPPRPAESIKVYRLTPGVDEGWTIDREGDA